MIFRSPMTRAIALRVLALLGLVSVPGKYGFEEECQESLGSANGPKTFQLFQKAGSFGRVVARGFSEWFWVCISIEGMLLEGRGIRQPVRPSSGCLWPVSSMTRS